MSGIVYEKLKREFEHLDNAIFPLEHLLLLLEVRIGADCYNPVWIEQIWSQALVFVNTGLSWVSPYSQSSGVPSESLGCIPGPLLFGDG